jgi:anti-sigma28 factor (negative regulator of flagellin synthesis)
MQELAVEWTWDIEETEKNVREAKQNVERVEELRAKIAAGSATADDMVEAADLLRRRESPDDDDIPDAPCDSEDQSSEYEKASKGGLKRKRKAKKPERKRAERKTEAGTERKRRGRKARVVETPPPEWKIAVGECE